MTPTGWEPLDSTCWACSPPQGEKYRARQTPHTYTEKLSPSCVKAHECFLKEDGFLFTSVTTLLRLFCRTTTTSDVSSPPLEMKMLEGCAFSAHPKQRLIVPIYLYVGVF